jgi:hypothetical protein
MYEWLHEDAAYAPVSFSLYGNHINNSWVEPETEHNMKQSPIERDEAYKKLLTDMLFREFEFYRQSSQKTDEMVFRLITVLVVPSLLLLGYTLYDPKFSVVVLVVPYFSLIGILILSSVFMRYTINGIYCKYLQKKLNDMLGRRIFIGVDLAKMFYAKGFSIVNAGIAIVSFSVLVINLCLIPSIHREIVGEAFQQRFHIPIIQNDILDWGVFSASVRVYSHLPSVH